MKFEEGSMRPKDKLQFTSSSDCAVDVRRRYKGAREGETRASGPSDCLNL